MWKIKVKDVRGWYTTNMLHTQIVCIVTNNISGIPIFILIINAHEGKYVAVFDVPRAYLNADIPEGKFVIFKIEGEFVNMMCEVNPEPKKMYTWKIE